MMFIGKSNSSGNCHSRAPEHNHGYFSPGKPVEKSGETRRDQDRGRIRDAFMELKGIDRPTFESKHGRGAGYKEWRTFAAEHGLALPA